MRRAVSFFPSLAALALLLAAAVGTDSARPPGPEDLQEVQELLDQASRWIHEPVLNAHQRTLQVALTGAQRPAESAEVRRLLLEGLELLEERVPVLDVSLEGDAPRRLRWRARPVVAGRPDFLILNVRPAAGALGRVVVTAAGGGVLIDEAVIELGGATVQRRLLRVEAPSAGTHDVELLFESAGRRGAVAFPLVARASGRLRVDLVLAGSAEGVPARVSVQSEDGRYWIPRALDGEKPSNFEVSFDSFYAEGAAELVVPAGPVEVRVARGFEFREVASAVEVSEGETARARIELARWVDMLSRGWWSVDTHLHYVSQSWFEEGDWDQLDLRKRAEDLNVGHVLPLQHWFKQERASLLRSSRFPPRRGVVPEFSSDRYVTVVGEEMRSHLYGHLVLWNIEGLVEPVSTGGIGGPELFDYPSNLEIARRVRAMGGLVSAAHDVIRDVPVLAAGGALDLVDVQRPDRWYSLLNAGYRLPAAIGSDYPANRMGFVRAYVRTGSQEFDWESFVAGLRAGRTFVSSGAVIELDVDGSGPGDTFRIGGTGPSKVFVTARAEWSSPLARLEIVNNGVVVHTVEPREPGERLELEGAVELRPGWVAARCSPNASLSWWSTPGVAHTSPVWLDNGRGPVIAQDAVEVLRAGAETLIEDVERRGKFETEAQRDQVLELYREASKDLEALDR